MDKTPHKAKGAWAKAWIVFGLCLAAFCAFQDLRSVWRHLSHADGDGIIALPPSQDYPGGFVDAGIALVPAPQQGDGQNRVVNLAPDAPLYKAGARDGDLVRFDNVFSAGKPIAAGEVLGLNIDHQGRQTHAFVTAVQTPWRVLWWRSLGEIILALILLSSVLTGAFILVRSQGQPAFLLLGLAFICFGNRASTPEFSMPVGLYPYVSTLCVLTLRIMPVLFLAFALRFYEDTTARRRVWAWWLLAVFGVAMVIAGGYLSYANQMFVTRPVIGNGIKIYTWLYFLNLAFIVAIFAMGLRQSDQPTRRRYVLMLIAILMVMLARGVIFVGVLFDLSNFHALFLLEFDNPLEVATAILAFVGPLLFAYAALRNKVLDLGFAVNRTLVYGVMSFAILLVFGLVEWGVEKLLPENFFEGHSAQIKMLVEAGIALSIFLIFHRVRDAVEKLVESVFFRAWHHNEALMRRFVAQSSYFTQTTPLIGAFMAELQRFSGGAECAIYLKEEGGYVRTAGSAKVAPKRIDGNDPVLVEIRTDRRRVDMDGHPRLPAGLALPMVHRAEVFGVVWLGKKPSSDDYRPDEKELLAWAAHQIGLDLHALQVEALQARVSDLAGEVKTLRSVVTGTPA